MRVVRVSTSCLRRFLTPPAVPMLAATIKPVRMMSLNAATSPPEETGLARFAQKRYFPVQPGLTLKGRYRIISKLGFGAYSTVWLAKDERNTRYTTIKICVHDETPDSPVNNEVQMLKYIDSCDRSGGGALYVRFPEEIFDVESEFGRHHCIAMQAQGCSLWKLQNLFPEAKMPVAVVMDAVQRILAGLTWLHATCDLVHSEVTAQNVLAQAITDSGFQALEEEELRNPSQPLMMDGSYPVYRSRGLPKSVLELNGEFLLTDFGSARKASPKNKGWWMPDTYRAPEVLMGLPWSHAVDPWCIGIMALELLEGKNFFNPIDPIHNQYVLPLAIAQYIGCMGLPPRWMIEKSENPVISTFFNDKGEWNHELPIPSHSLEDFVSLPAGEERTAFLKFLRRILTWDPEKRATAYDLFHDEWLMSPTFST